MLATVLVLVTHRVEEMLSVDQTVAVIERMESKLVILEKASHTVL